ncbi:tyrosine-type recombinase/integrase [Endozoicomonas atrinae]|uniref:tyrosine-type recombinase/integrase n=1 Tax=Endozoicomonas atrinae TaxID=1333660 RepID=UPI000824577F|nr:integrase family protein [Endozoicomonas atrinae]
MPEEKLSDAKIRNKKPSDKEEIITDLQSGVHLRIYPSGQKSFGWRYRDKFREGKLSRVSYGDYPNRTLEEARRIHDAVTSARKNGVDVKEPNTLDELIRSTVKDTSANKPGSSSGSITFDDLVDQFFANYIEKEGIGPRPYNRIKNHMQPYFGLYPVDAIPDAAIEQFMITKREEGCSEKTIGDTVRFTCNMYDWAIKQFICKVNPFNKYRLKRSNKNRKSYFSMLEIRTLLNNKENHPISPDYFLIQTALLLSGCRRSEVTKAMIDEFDFDLNVWTIPPDRLKNQKRVADDQKEPFPLPMSTQLAGALRELIDRFGNDTHIFGSKRVGQFDKTMKRTGPACDRTYDTYITGYRKLHGIENRKNHDLRRTLETHLTNLGVSPDITTAMTGHSREGMKGVYNHAQQTHLMRTGFQLWADFIDFICSKDEKYAKAFDKQAPTEELLEIFKTFNFKERSVTMLNSFSSS